MLSLDVPAVGTNEDAADIAVSERIFHRYVGLVTDICESADPNTDPAKGDARLRLKMLAGAAKSHPSLARAGNHIEHVYQAGEKWIAGRPMRNWSEVLTWARFAASPEGAFIAALHGENKACQGGLESLFSARFLLNRLARISAVPPETAANLFPADWRRADDIDAASFSSGTSGTALRKIFSLYLDAVFRLIAHARQILPSLSAPGLRRRVLFWLRETIMLGNRLRRADPLEGPVAISRWDRCVMRIMPLRAAVSGT